MIFAIIFVIINGHTCKLFKNILNDVQTEGNIIYARKLQLILPVAVTVSMFVVLKFVPQLDPANPLKGRRL